MYPVVRIVLVFLLASHLIAQTPPAPVVPVTTLSVTTRIVYVDVVVRDSDGHFVRGVPRQRFKLSEDGVPEQIDFFDEHTHALAAGRANPIPQPPASSLEFSNVPSGGMASGSVNILLFDLVNTPSGDQLYAREQMLKFLKALPPGQQIALFVLTDRLHMIQSFTGSSDLLIVAAQLLKAKPASLIRGESEQMQDVDILAKWARAIGTTPSMQSSSGGIEQRWKNENTASDAQNADIRARITINAFAELARATSGYPGRKNLLWLAGDFPVSVGAYLQLNDLSRDPDHQISDLPGARATANLIASMQIAVYPISVLGLQSGSVTSAASADGEINLMGPQGSFGGSLSKTNSSQFDARATLRSNMENIAQQTGGEPFFATNDLAGALRRSMEDGSNFYTLAYRPKNQDWNGKFRKIHVELDGRHYDLTYRRGYFAYPDRPSTVDAQQELNAALQPETPSSTMLLLNAKILLPDAQHSAVRIESVIDPRGVEFTTSADGRRKARLLVLLVALTDIPAQAAQPPQASGVLNLDLDDAGYRAVLQSGIPVHMQIALPAGKYRLRLGAADVANHRLGTLDMPLAIPATRGPA